MQPTKMKTALSACLLTILFSATTAYTQSFQPEYIRNNNDVKSVKLFPINDQLAYPITQLNVENGLELHFDDLAASSRNYYYTYQLCDADWTPVTLSQFDYLKGFSQVRLNVFRPSSVALTRYTHYTTTLPVRNCMPSRSGNYLLKVFENGDTSKLLFTKRMLIVDNKAGVGATVIQPFSGRDFNTHQRVTVNINPNNLDIFNTNQQLKVVVLQNFRWDHAQMGTTPTFIRNRNLEFNQEGLFDFEGGKEYRWLDLRSFRLQSDRVRKAAYGNGGTNILVAPDTARPTFRYQYYKDFNGLYYVAMLEDYNPWWQSDYATVHFTFIPPNREPWTDKELFVVGEMTGYREDESSRLTFNKEQGVYEKDLFLKNGYYSYAYVTKDHLPGAQSTFKFTEGNTWDAENQYTVLVYYRSFGGRADELVGSVNVNTLNLKTQLRF
jgi:hypothetical protein